MIFLVIKKWFFNLWDNFLTVIVMNVIFAASLAVSFLIPGFLFEYQSELAWGVRALGIVLSVWLSGIISHLLGSIIQGKPIVKNEWKRALKNSFFPALVLSLVSTALYFLVVAVGTYYWDSNSVFGPAGVILCVWIVLFYLLLVQSYWPLNVQLERRLSKLWKKCYLLLIDNLAYSFFLVFAFILLAALSVLTSGLFPGVAGVLLFLQVAFTLRIKKYDWLETLSEGQPRRPVPWSEILKEEKDRLGKRTLKSLIFPWQD